MSDENQKMTAAKGMQDILPKQISAWQHVENIIRNLMANYAYEEIRTPLIEKNQLFKRSVGEVTDIVEKEMYTFAEKGGEVLSVRPEGTAGCVRACVEHALVRNQQQQKLWYMGPMCRYEQPQKGRFRQFSQLGVEAFSFSGPDVDAEQIALTARLWQQLKIDHIITLQINSLGNAESRAKHKQDLVAYFSANINQLDEDSKRRLTTNPLRILDSKNPDMQNLIDKAPKLLDYIDAESAAHFAGLQQHLNKLGIKFTINSRLVRGLDYYNRTVYEWVTDKLGAQSTVCGGGRYDTLVSTLGGPETPAVGFALGVERVLLLLEATQQNFSYQLDGYLMCISPAAAENSLVLAEKIRDLLPNFSLETHMGTGTFTSLFRKADKSGAKIAFIIGEDELANGTIGIKFLREDRQQLTVKMDQINSALGDL